MYAPLRNPALPPVPRPLHERPPIYFYIFHATDPPPCPSGNAQEFAPSPGASLCDRGVREPAPIAFLRDKDMFRIFFSYVAPHLEGEPDCRKYLVTSKTLWCLYGGPHDNDWAFEEEEVPYTYVRYIRKNTNDGQTRTPLVRSLVKCLHEPWKFVGDAGRR